MRHYSYSMNHLQRGFSLLELLMVVGLLSVLAIASMTVIIDTKDIESLDATEKRWNQIRYAIIGDTSRTLNNEPMMSGYVADMGRLPANLKELTTQATQPAWASIQLDTVTTNVTGSLSGGWRGPYLYTAGSAFFRDGWGNEDVIPANDAINFGWQVSHMPASAPVCTTVPDCTDIQVESFGGDNAAGGAEFGEDFPLTVTNLVSANEWQLTGATIDFNVVFNKPPSANRNGLELRIYFFEDTAIQEEISTEQFDLLSADTTPNTQSVRISGPLPMGKYAAVVWCSIESVVYDGGCTGSTKQPYYFTLLPSTIPAITIPWNIP